MSAWARTTTAPAIAENRRRAVAAVAPGRKLVTLHQVHSANALVATEPWPDEARPHADAVVTDRPGLVLGILTADCAPVLLAEPTPESSAPPMRLEGRAWRRDRVRHGRDGIARRRPRPHRRGNRPGHRPQSYEVDEGLARRFAEADPDNDRFFSPGREAITSSISKAIVAPASPRPASTGRGARPRHLFRRRPLLQLPPRHPSRRARLWAPDRADRAARVKALHHAQPLILSRD
jgi:hypothetical protein